MRRFIITLTFYLSIVAMPLMGLADSPATNDLAGLESAFNTAVRAIGTKPPNEKEAAYEQLRSTVSLMVGALMSQDILGSAESVQASNDGITDFIYEAFIGDARPLQRKIHLEGPQSPAAVVLSQRLRSLVSAYPLAHESSRSERISMTLYLAYVVGYLPPDDTRTLLEGRLTQLSQTERVPILFSLAELGNKEAKSTLEKDTSKETQMLKLVFDGASKVAADWKHREEEKQLKRSTDISPK